MGAIVAIWAFFCFLGYRILTQFFFDDALSILACLLCSMITACVIFFVTGAYLLKGLQSATRIRLGHNNSRWFGTLIGHFVIACTVNALACFAIAFGFSERFYNAVSRTRYRSDFYEQGWFIFTVILILPLAVHFAMIVFSIRAQNQAAKNEIHEET